jgi:hypothetical protein
MSLSQAFEGKRARKLDHLENIVETIQESFAFSFETLMKRCRGSAGCFCGLDIIIFISSM